MINTLLMTRLPTIKISISLTILFILLHGQQKNKQNSTLSNFELGNVIFGKWFKT